MTPLVDLHRHLEGSNRPETSIELATRTGTDLLPAQWRAALVAAEREEGLLPYLAKSENATVLVRTLDDWRRVTVEAVTDAHADGLAALELRFAPQFIAGVTDLDADLAFKVKQFTIKRGDKVALAARFERKTAVAVNNDPPVKNVATLDRLDPATVVESALQSSNVHGTRPRSADRFRGLYSWAVLFAWLPRRMHSSNVVPSLVT